MQRFETRHRRANDRSVRIWFARLILVSIAFIGMEVKTSVAAPSDDESEQPNVVIFFIDDLGYTDLGCYGSKYYETPNIDSLAQRSIRFTNFYSAHPVCSPTRAAMMTGKAPQRMGITQWIPQPNEKHLPKDEFTMAEAFQEAGYSTGYIGKWHLGDKDSDFPTNHGFDWMRCVNRGGAPGSYYHPFKRNNARSKKIDYWAVPDLEDAVSGDYLTDKATDHALSFIKDRSSSDKPFFLCFGHYAVHTPIQPPKSLVEKYKVKRNEMYQKTEADAIDESGKGSTRARQDNADYAAMIENLDANVGRVLAQLDELKLTEKTIVIFTSDNGGLSTLQKRDNKKARVGPTNCSPLRAGKGWTYEGGIRIPTMIAWPGTLEPAVTDTRGITMDLYPTLLDLTGQPLLRSQHRDGVTLVSALKGKPDQSLKDRFLAWHYPHKHGSGHTPSNAMRQGPWKLIHHTDSGQYELFNLDSDLGETTDLSKKHPERTSELAEVLANWIEWTTK